MSAARDLESVLAARYWLTDAGIRVTDALREQEAGDAGR